MTRLGLYIVFFATIFNNLSLGQFAKLPVLFEHYQAHQQRNAQIALLDFLSMHYWGNDINDDDDSEDRKLPFRDHTVTTFASYYTPYFPIEAPTPALSFVDTDIKHPHAFIPNMHLGALFRPPQV